MRGRGVLGGGGIRAAIDRVDRSARPVQSTGSLPPFGCAFLDHRPTAAAGSRGAGARPCGGPRARPTPRRRSSRASGAPWPSLSRLLLPAVRPAARLAGFGCELSALCVGLRGRRFVNRFTFIIIIIIRRAALLASGGYSPVAARPRQDNRSLAACVLTRSRSNPLNRSSPNHVSIRTDLASHPLFPIDASPQAPPNRSKSRVQSEAKANKASIHRIRSRRPTSNGLT